MEMDEAPVVERTTPENRIITEVTPSPSFDLESYISNYSGRTKALRLKFIAERVPALQLEAMRMLLQEVKSGQNANLYKEVMELIGNKLGNVFDPQWVERAQEQNDKQVDKLEVDLCQHKLNSIKEKVRMGHNDLGNHHYAVGNLNEALKCFMRTRDYGTTAKHTLDMCLSIIRVSIEMGNFSHVSNYVTKAEAQPEPAPATDLSVTSKLRAAAGLAQLDSGKYKQAALKFTSMKIEVGKENNVPIIKNIHPDELCYSEVLAPQDVAIYGGLCALASFDRTELATKVMEDSAMKQFLDLVPDVREIISDFYHSRYSSCLALMEKIRGDLLLDIYMNAHVEKLYAMVRSKALIQCFTPFASVQMPMMAQAFSTTVPALQKELTELIMKKDIKARIDSHNKIVYARQADQEVSTFHKALQTGLEYERQTKALLLRLDLVRNDMSIKASRGGIHGPPRGDREED